MKYYAPLKLSDNIRETPEGFLVCVGVPIARTGWQVYAAGECPLQPGPDGKILVFRDAKQVFSADTIASFEGKALTIEHPADWVSPENWKMLAKGVLQNIRRGDKDEEGEESLLADVLVTDLSAIQLVKSGLREVSCGYEAVYEQTEVGKGTQTHIIGNHLALVKAGRAGPGYAIHDHKERISTMGKLAEKVKQLFSKAADDAVAVAEEFEKKTKDEMPGDKDKDQDKSKDDEGKLEKKADGALSYDELVKMVKDMGEKVSGLVSRDAEVSPKMEERLKKMEDAMSKLMESESDESEAKDADSDEDKADKEEVGDDDDADGDKDEMTGDTAARAEILSPGIRITKDVKVKALKNAYATKDGKKVIDSLTGGKAPSFDSAEQVSNLFIASSEIIKAKRGTGLENTKNSRSSDSAVPSTAEGMSAEKLNEINQKFYSQT